MKRAQSAMEYLMTYGWAILIIAVVLGVLFQLGVFSGSALTPKAQPGSCSVQRLLGQTSLEGQCTGLLPQFVAAFSGHGSGPEGKIKDSMSTTVTSLTISAWIKQTNSNPSWQNIAGVGNSIEQIAIGITGAPQAVIRASSPNLQPAGGTAIQPNTYYMITGTWSANGVYWSESVYLDGVQEASGTMATGIASQPLTVFDIGDYSTYGLMYAFNGTIANVQAYNTTLSTNEILALYNEGIGGAPVKIQNLIGWWPLNGNANDYSGNNDNGQISGQAAFNSTWQSTYTPP